MTKKNRERVVLFFASAAYSGYFPFASGTFATLFPAVPIYLALAHASTLVYAVTTVILTLICVFLSAQAEQILKEKDPHKVTLDEVVGFLVTMFAIVPTLKVVIAGFFLFRFFDVLKVNPARWVEKKAPGGLGITLDDVVAGLWSHAVLRLLLTLGLLT